MNRRDAVVALLAYGVVPLDAWAQQPRKVVRIGWLSPSSPSGFAPQLGAFRQGLRERGYIEGENIVIEYRFGGEGTDMVGDLAVELVSLKVDILVPVSGPAVRAAKDATGTIPIVAHDLQTDPVRAGLVASLARPGGNLTGFFLDLAELGGKHVELLKEAVPGLSRVAALWPAASFSISAASCRGSSAITGGETPSPGGARTLRFRESIRSSDQGPRPSPHRVCLAHFLFSSSRDRRSGSQGQATDYFSARRFRGVWRPYDLRPESSRDVSASGLLRG